MSARPGGYVPAAGHDGLQSAATVGLTKKADETGGRVKGGEKLGARFLLPRIDLETAELARLRGDDAARERALRKAHRSFSEIGATGHAERMAKDLGL